MAKTNANASDEPARARSGVALSERRDSGPAERLPLSERRRETIPVLSGPPEPNRELHDSLHRAALLIRDLDAAMSTAGERANATTGKMRDLEQRVGALETGGRQLVTRLFESEQRAKKLMRFFVMAHQLHSTLDPKEVITAIAEITINVVGSECFFVLVDRGEDDEFELAYSEGIDKASFEKGRYSGGDRLIDAALASGKVQLGPKSRSRALAVAPMALGEHAIGAIVIERLLPQKPALDEDDIELLEIFGMHAASALVGARALSTLERRRRRREGRDDA